MIRPPLIRLFLILTSVALPLAVAQTATIADPNVAGGSIVEVISTNANGLPVTQIVQSISAGAVAGATTSANTLTATTPTLAAPVATTSSSSPITTLTPQATEQGPVAQPAPTIPVGQGVTEYTYTTVNALGQTTVLQDFFTPTYNTPSPPSSPAVGTVLGMSAWSALIGTNTAGGPTNGVVSWQLTRSGVGGLVALGSCFVAGALTVL